MLHGVVVVVEYDAETSLGLLEDGSDSVAGHRRPRGRATATVRITVARRVLVAAAAVVVAGLVARQPTSWMVMVVLWRRRQRVMVVQLMVRLLLMVVLVMARQRVPVRAAVFVERTADAARLLSIVVLIVRRSNAAAAANVRRVQFVRVRCAPALCQRHALLVAEQLPFQAVVFRLQSGDLTPVKKQQIFDVII